MKRLHIGHAFCRNPVSAKKKKKSCYSCFFTGNFQLKAFFNLHLFVFEFCREKNDLTLYSNKKSDLLTLYVLSAFCLRLSTDNWRRVCCQADPGGGESDHVGNLGEFIITSSVPSCVLNSPC